MRLIDADKLETDTIYATHLNHVECGYHYSYSEGRINEAPTVDAIPIKWIKRYWDSHRVDDMTIWNMLNAWEEENEKKY